MDEQMNDERRDLNQQVERILQSRQICRPVLGHPLSDTQQAVIERVRQYLWHELAQKPDQFTSEPRQVNSRQFELCQLAFRKALDDVTLTQLAIAAQNCPGRTPLRRHALGELIQALHLSGQLRWQQQLPDGIDSREVMSKTLIYICEHIDQFDPQKGTVMAWVHNRQKWNLHRLREEYADPWIQSVRGRLIREKTKLKAVLRTVRRETVYGWLQLKIKGKLSEKSGELSIATVLLTSLLLCQLSNSQFSEVLTGMVESSISMPIRITVQHGEPVDLENIEQEATETSLSLSEQVREYIEADPEQLFQKSVKGHPTVTFQAIALAHLNDVSWNELSAQFEVPIPTLSSFYQRELKRLAPHIRRHIQTNG